MIQCQTTAIKTKNYKAAKEWKRRRNVLERCMKELSEEFAKQPV